MNVSIERLILMLGLLTAAAAHLSAAGDGSRLFPSCPMTPCPGVGPGQELLGDLTFSRGFRVSSRRPWDQPNELGDLSLEGINDAGRPVWRLAQWHATPLLEPGPLPQSGDPDTWTARTDTSEVTIRRDPSDVTLVLAFQGIREFAGRPRQPGEPWPHLLIEQVLEAPPVGKLARLMFQLRFRVEGVRADPALTSGLDPSLHTAQASAYWTVSVAMADGSQDKFWFGIPLFDARYPVPPAYCAPDAGFPGATQKYIYTVAGDRFWAGSTGDGSPRETEIDLIPLLREALEAIQAQGSLREARPETLRLTSFNLGWEITGPYDARLELSGLSLRAVPGQPGEPSGETAQ